MVRTQLVAARHTPRGTVVPGSVHVVGAVQLGVVAIARSTSVLGAVNARVPVRLGMLAVVHARAAARIGPTQRVARVAVVALFVVRLVLVTAATGTRVFSWLRMCMLVLCPYRPLGFILRTVVLLVLFITRVGLAVELDRLDVEVLESDLDERDGERVADNRRQDKRVCDGLGQHANAHRHRRRIIGLELVQDHAEVEERAGTDGRKVAHEARLCHVVQCRHVAVECDHGRQSTQQQHEHAHEDKLGRCDAVVRVVERVPRDRGAEEAEKDEVEQQIQAVVHLGLFALLAIEVSPGKRIAGDESSKQVVDLQHATRADDKHAHGRTEQQEALLVDQVAVGGELDEPATHVADEDAVDDGAADGVDARLKQPAGERLRGGVELDEMHGEEEEGVTEAVVGAALCRDEVAQPGRYVLVCESALDDGVGQHGIGGCGRGGDDEPGEQRKRRDDEPDAEGGGEPHDGHDGDEQHHETAQLDPRILVRQLDAHQRELDADHHAAQAERDLVDIHLLGRPVEDATQAIGSQTDAYEHGERRLSEVEPLLDEVGEGAVGHKEEAERGAQEVERGHLEIDRHLDGGFPAREVRVTSDAGEVIRWRRSSLKATWRREQCRGSMMRTEKSAEWHCQGDLCVQACVELQLSVHISRGLHTAAGVQARPLSTHVSVTPPKRKKKRGGKRIGKNG
ncbi:hypothetical protein L1887_53620 [Cichorium endivia]|nr:hypothetical protein L1887_53620 [Cichorium endivia]